MAPLPDGHGTNHAFGFALEGMGYLVAGETEDGLSDAFYRYDPVSDSWTSLEDFPGDARGYAIGDVHEGKAYFGFGSSNNGKLNDLWEYDPSTGEWSALEPCPCSGRLHPAMVAENGVIHVGLGGDDTGDVNDWWVYNIATDSWSAAPDFPGTQRHHPYQFGLNGLAYVGFGHHTATIFNTWYSYDPVTQDWQQRASLPDQGRVAGTQFSHGGKGYALSGDGEGHDQMPTGEFWEYNPNSDAWTQWPAHPGMSRWAPASFVIDDVVYLVNGMNISSGSFDFVLDNWKFSMVSDVAQDAGLSGTDMEPEVCAGDPVPVVAQLTNWGSDVLNAAFLEMIIGGEVVLSQNWAGSLSMYATSEVTLGEYVFTEDTDFTLKVTTGDTNPSNDEVQGAVLMAPEGTTEWRIDLLTDFWGDETGWQVRDLAGNVIASVAADTYGDNTAYTEYVSLPNTGCFEFVLTDTYGDGMIGTQSGNAPTGSCTVWALDGAGNPLAELYSYDGSSGFSEEIQPVNVETAVGIADAAMGPGRLSVFPNPAAQQFTLNCAVSAGLPVAVEVRDVMGRLVASRPWPAGPVLTMDSREWPQGTYFVTVETPSGRLTQKVIRAPH